MMRLAFGLSLAIFAVALGAGFTSASATKMNGKCCLSSDGGRSYRYRTATKRAAIPRTCNAYAAACIRTSSMKPDKVQRCMAAKAQCIRTSVHVGPYSSREYAGMQKK
jgi:hypothetical protein